MRLVIESAAESRDGVSIERHTPMTNTELTLDQLQTINGGAAFMKLGDIRGEYRQIMHPQFKAGRNEHGIIIDNPGTAPHLGTTACLV